jgi:hypothetical protein
VDVAEVDRRIELLAQQPFRARFHLRGRDRSIAELRGPATIRRHAEQLIRQRVGPAEPRKDGKQTPYRGHPVFVAQHATATCCRTCLAKWHGIAKGTALTDDEVSDVVDVIVRWIGRELQA